MQIRISQYNPTNTTDCLILPIYQDKQQPLITTEFNNKNKNIVDKLMETKDVTGKHGEIKWLYDVGSLPRVMLVGIGNPDNLTSNRYLALIHSSFAQILDKKLGTVSNGLIDVQLPNSYKSLNKPEYKSLKWKANQIILAAHSYNSPVKKYQQAAPESLLVGNYELVSLEALPNDQQLKDLVQKNVVMAEAIKTAKDLGNMPPNLCNPIFIAEQAQSFAYSHPEVECTIFKHEQLVEMGMGAFGAVSQGSDNHGRMVVLEYYGAHDRSVQPYVLIGKGITFDTGGYTLKPAASMLGMKYDMCGAASVLATMQAAVEYKLPINIVGILACAENMIGHRSTRPNDIVKSLKGKTIEINNTDAEGRLVLCDAMTYSERFRPKLIIDVATLTGAAVVALGYQYTAMFTNQDQLKDDLLQASYEGHDPVWPMPLCHDYDDLLKNPFADLQNASSKPIAGSITAACFLANFVPENTPWAHLDIAGTATVTGDHNNATGRPVSLLINYLTRQSETQHR